MNTLVFSLFKYKVPTTHVVSYKDNNYKTKDTISLSSNDYNGTNLNDISIRDNPLRLKSIIDSDASNNTCCGSIHGPALKLCFFIF